MRGASKKAQATERRCRMRVVDLPLDTWVVVEPLGVGEVELLSTHATQRQAEAERDARNKRLGVHRCNAIKTLAPTASALACAAAVAHKRRHA
jgi:hypothetical protein